MKTAEIINAVCSELGTTKAEFAKRIGIHPSSLYRKLARESMTLEEFQFADRAEQCSRICRAWYETQFHCADCKSNL